MTMPMIANDHTAIKRPWPVRPPSTKRQTGVYVPAIKTKIIIWSSFWKYSKILPLVLIPWKVALEAYNKIILNIKIVTAQTPVVFKWDKAFKITGTNPAMARTIAIKWVMALAGSRKRNADVIRNTSKTTSGFKNYVSIN